MGDLFSFSGRAGRLQYWGISLLCGLIIFGIEMATSDKMVAASDISMVSLTALIFAIILIIWVNLAVTVRRFHDRGKSGLWFFALLIPLVGLWFAIELAFFGGVDEGNAYGTA